MIASVVDANIFKLFFEALLYDLESDATELIRSILVSGHIAFDEKRYVEHEWRDTSCGDNAEIFNSWIQARMLEDKIQLYADLTNAHLKKRAKNEFGIPKRDIKYICLAISAKAA